jgi:hypothetical protein
MNHCGAQLPNLFSALWVLDEGANFADARRVLKRVNSVGEFALALRTRCASAHHCLVELNRMRFKVVHVVLCGVFDRMLPDLIDDCLEKVDVKRRRLILQGHPSVDGRHRILNMR